MNRAQALTLYDLGCKPGDPTFDNGVMIEKALAENRITEPIICPGRAWHFPRPCDLRSHGGLRFVGSGMALWQPSEGSYARNYPAACRFVGERIFISRGAGNVFEGINFHNGYWSRERPEWGDSTAVEYICNKSRNPPTGKDEYNGCTFAGFRTCIHLAASDHNDNIGGGKVLVHSCGSFIVSDEEQSGGFDFRQIHAGGYVDTLFDMRRGGSLHVGSLGVMNRMLVLRSGNNTNSCFYRFDAIEADNHAAGWRLVEAIGPVYLIARGHMDKKGVPADDWITVLPPSYGPDSQIMDVRLWRNNKLWPRGGE